MTTGPERAPDASMTLITEMMQRPLDPGYAAAAQSRQESGLPASTGVRSPMLLIAAGLIGALLAVSALTLRAPATIANEIKTDLVARIEAGRSHADAATLLIDRLRNEINAAQAAALTRQGQTGLAAELARLEIAAGTVPVTGPGLIITIDDAVSRTDVNGPDTDPRTSADVDLGKVQAQDVQRIVNGLWEAGAEAISINDHRLTSLSAIRFAGEAILVGNRPLSRPYVITAIGDPNSLDVEFADNDGGAHLNVLANFKIRSSIASSKSVTVPGQPSLSLEKARPSRLTGASPTVTTVTTAPANTGTDPATSNPPPTETSP